MVRNLNSPYIFTVLRGTMGRTPNEHQGLIVQGITPQVDLISRVEKIL